MLKGEKVTLRSVERDDLKRLHELSQNVDLMILSGGAWSPWPLASLEKEFDDHVKDEDHSDFLIETDGKIIGTIGLHRWKNRRAGSANLGISILDHEYLGRGYGRDALKTLLDWAFRIQNFRRIGLETMATNERAIRSYRACGFVEEGRLRQAEYSDGNYVDVLAMGILRSEWETLRAASPTAK